MLLNRYRLLELVGQGAMGRVYRAEDTLLGQVIVAVKFLSQTLLNQKMRDRFEREAKICALLGEKTIHIVRVRDYGIDEQGVPFYVMEFLQGQTIGDILDLAPLPLDRFGYLMRQICVGMESAHSGISYQGENSLIIHRDIKPSNVLVVQDNTLGELVKILDFGIAKLAQSNTKQTHSFMGTLAYCSPEQMEGKELDYRSDIYSLGVMMYEMLCGEMPIIGENNTFGAWYQAHHDQVPPPIPPHYQIPPAVEAIVMACLAKSRSDRPQSIREVWEKLDPLMPPYSPKFRTIPEDKTQPLPESMLESGEKSLVLPSLASPTDVCRQARWPEDKPRQKIVFPRVIRTSNRIIPTLLAMIEGDEIRKRKAFVRYNQFVFLGTPHPMVLWISVIFDPIFGPRWFPCYLDLKTDAGQKIARTLSTCKDYYLLLFPLEEDQTCQAVIPMTISDALCEKLLEWSKFSLDKPVNRPLASKNQLRKELDILKPQIQQKLELSLAKLQKKTTSVSPLSPFN